jgi:hypothetical protein
MFSQIAEAEKPFKTIMDLPMIKEDKVVLFAILVQNALQPKNKQRTEAITAKTYQEIKSRANAEEFLTALLKTNLENELRSVESEVVNQFKSLETMQDVKMVLDAPDSFYAAAVMT